MTIALDRSARDSSSVVRLLPDDEHNRALVSNSHPERWVNPTPRWRYHLVVIGSGTAGLTAAAGCVAVGGRVALIERHLTGGDCLISGCVPSKGIISAARVAAWIERAADYGIRVAAGTIVDFPAVMARMRRLRAEISPSDSVHHLKEMGVEVFLGQGRFTGPDTVDVNGTTLRFARAVIATGGRAIVPTIPGLTESGFLTNETLFQLTELPKRFAMIGAGPIGCEMAQTFQRLGAQVTLIDTASHILIREDADAAEIVQRAFVRGGVRLVLNAKVTAVESHEGAKRIRIDQGGKPLEIVCDAILVGVGRAPNTDGLSLEAAGVRSDKTGVLSNDFLRTSNPRIFAAGDIASPFKFTHTANALGRMAMINALFWGRNRMSRLVVPWCTYTAPEIAHVGLYERQAKERGIPVTTLTAPLSENDRAILDGETAGFVRVHLTRGTDRILGATVVAAHAGDLLTYFTLAMTGKRGLASLAGAIYPYPTQSEVIKKLANLHRASALKPWVKRLLSTLLALKR
ncbi:MAG: mercuric reductase [Candidatus Omnitrophica bacterium]|nr:mercuric reductase [Candidatus Omnitrophota bacterium]MBI2495089.1 mercuric reductase [Candidatus Omnitrophota bacterium]MBI3021133.1 mercuric reductase [Candidatus Omnitrophota bacterium]